MILMIKLLVDNDFFFMRSPLGSLGGGGDLNSTEHSKGLKAKKIM